MGMVFTLQFIIVCIRFIIAVDVNLNNLLCSEVAGICGVYGDQKYNSNDIQSDSIIQNGIEVKSTDTNPTLRYSNTIEQRLSIHLGLFTEES